MSPLTYRLAIPFLLFASASILVRAADPAPAPATVERPNDGRGYCHYCSNDNAPPLCNRDCDKAINELCNNDLKKAWNVTVGSCQALYLEAPWEYWKNKAEPSAPSGYQCQQKFQSILNDCGKDASSDAEYYKADYCTSSGGGGTYGWMSDGSPIEGSARYRLSTPGDDACGQTKAFWWQADNVIPWDPAWVPENAEVKLITNPPPLDPALQALANQVPMEDPLCKDHACDVFGKPVYADNNNKPPWDEYGSERHEIRFQGLDPKILQNAVTQRCGASQVDNSQVWTDPENNSIGLMDVSIKNKNTYLPGTTNSDPCPCLMDAVFDASGGALINPPNTWCSNTIVFDPPKEFRDEFRKMRKREEVKEKKVVWPESRFQQPS